VPGTPFASIDFSWDVKVDRHNRFAFVTETQPAELSVFRIAPATGALTLASVSPFGFDPRAMVLHPTRPFLYAADLGSELHARRFDETTGLPTPVPGSPFVGPVLSSGLAIHPNGRFLYVSELQTSPTAFDGSVWPYAIDPESGALSSIGAPVPTGVRTRGLVIDPDGRHLYAANADTANVSVFSIDGDSGLLTPLGAPVAALPDVRTLFLSHDGRFLYAVVRGDHALLTYARNTVTGALAAQGPPLNLPASPEHAALDCSGRLLYVAHGDPVNSVSVVRIDPANGAATLAGGSTLPQAATYGIATTTFGCAPSQLSPR
jgi:6-phosphogluconolactonase (cycloisomerase 2 family)